MTDLGTYGWSWGPRTPRDLNDHGEVVGWLEEPSGAYHAFIAHDGTITELGTVVGTKAEPSAINNHRQVVGWGRASPSSRESRAFLWQAGTAVDLGAFAQAWSLAQNISDCGQVVGTSGPAIQNNHAILWVTPVPRE
jgi:probable HAF family extracellular repeat protein